MCQLPHLLLIASFVSRFVSRIVSQTAHWRQQLGSRVLEAGSRGEAVSGAAVGFDGDGSGHTAAACANADYEPTCANSSAAAWCTYYYNSAPACTHSSSRLGKATAVSSPLDQQRPERHFPCCTDLDGCVSGCAWVIHASLLGCQAEAEIVH
jgi:hypothetical protein